MCPCPFDACRADFCRSVSAIRPPLGGSNSSGVELMLPGAREVQPAPPWLSVLAPGKSLDVLATIFFALRGAGHLLAVLPGGRANQQEHGRAGVLLSPLPGSGCAGLTSPGWISLSLGARWGGKPVVCLDGEDGDGDCLLLGAGAWGRERATGSSSCQERLMPGWFNFLC